MTADELGLLVQIDKDRRDKGLRAKEKMHYVGMSHDNAGSEKYEIGPARPPRNKRKLQPRTT